MVNATRSQSKEPPSRIICWVIFSWYLNVSLDSRIPTDSRVLPLPDSFQEFFSSVMMPRMTLGLDQSLLHDSLSCNTSVVVSGNPERGVPLHSFPSVSWADGASHHRIMVSSNDTVKACPICRFPVTLGGGKAMLNVPFGNGSPFSWYLGLKKPLACHQS